MKQQGIGERCASNGGSFSFWGSRCYECYGNSIDGGFGGGGNFICRKGTPLYYVKTEAEEVEEVRWWLTEGVDVSYIMWNGGAVIIISLALRETLSGERRYRPRTPAMALGLTDQF